MIKTRFIPAPIKERKRTYNTWTKTGVECDQIANLCDLCPIWLVFGLRTGNGCHQQEANEILKEKGIPMPGQGFRFVRYERGQDERD